MVHDDAKKKKRGSSLHFYSPSARTTGAWCLHKEDILGSIENPSRQVEHVNDAEDGPGAGEDAERPGDTR